MRHFTSVRLRGFAEFGVKTASIDASGKVKYPLDNWSMPLIPGKYVLVLFDNALINVIASLQYLYGSIATAHSHST
jgi:hypothetical protein